MTQKQKNITKHLNAGGTISGRFMHHAAIYDKTGRFITNIRKDCLDRLVKSGFLLAESNSNTISYKLKSKLS